MTKLEFLDRLLDRITLSAVMMLIFVVGFFALVFIQLFHSAPEGSEKNVTVMIQAVIGFVGIIVGYIWGSSKRSDKQSNLIEKQLEDK